jgi:hypothetical protein
MKYTKTIITFGAMMSLSACLGSGSDDDYVTKADVEALATKAAAAVEPAEEELSGTATMTGVAILELGDTPLLAGDPVVGNMEVTADFEEGKITGAATNLAFYTVEGEGEEATIGQVDEYITGQLDLVGTISEDDFVGDLTGDLSYSESQTVEGVAVTVDLSGDVTTTVDGSFLSNDGDLVAAADIEGSVVLSGSVTALGKTTDIDEAYVEISGALVVSE